MTSFLALHWPHQTIVAADHPDGWARAFQLCYRDLPYQPRPGPATVAVTYRARNGRTVQRPLDHQRVRQALRLAEQYTLHEYTEDTYA